MQEIAERSPLIVSDSSFAQSLGGASLFLMNSDLSTGGTERQFSLIARSLRNGSFDLHLGCMHRRGAFLEGIGDIAEFDVGGSFMTRQAQQARRALAQHLRERSIAVAHSFDFYANLMLIPVARYARVPVVIGSQRNLGDLLSPMRRAALFMMFCLCTKVVCNSRAAALRVLNQGLPESRIAVIPNGLPEDAFVSPELVFRQNSGPLRVGLVARMNHHVKNQTMFLQAAARLASRFSEAEFLLVGDGPYRRDLERLAERLGIAHRVKFLGERRDMPAVLATLDISVVASNSESLSNVILESMAAGRPVIATRVGGNTELVRDGETGLLIPPQDVDALAHAVEKLLTAPGLRQQMGQTARIVARRDFSLKQVCGQYEQLYVSLLDKKGWRRGSRVPVPKKMNT